MKKKKTLLVVSSVLMVVALSGFANPDKTVHSASWLEQPLHENVLTSETVKCIVSGIEKRESNAQMTSKPMCKAVNIAGNHVPVPEQQRIKHNVERYIYNHRASIAAAMKPKH